jgi:hypothetical protein
MLEQREMYMTISYTDYKRVQRKKKKTEKKRGRENNRVKTYIHTTATERRILGEVEKHGRKDKYT